METSSIKKFIKRNSIRIFLICITIVITVSSIKVFSKNQCGNSNDKIHSKSTRNVERLVSVRENDCEGYTPEQIRNWVYGEEIPPRKMVFLTIDDGPSHNNTPRVLNILKENDIKATFFYVTGYNFESKAEVVKRTYNEGHSIGLHSNSHDYDLLYPGGVCRSESIIEDLKECEERIRNIIPDFKADIMRFPGGSFSWENNKDAKERIRKLGLDYVDWNIMTGDADNSDRDKSPDGIVEYVDQIYTDIGEPDVLVLLMHDPSYMDCTPDSLQALINYFKKKGYSFEKII